MDDEIEVVNGVAKAQSGEALGGDYAPTSSVDLTDLSRSWGIDFDSDAVGPSNNDSSLQSSNKTAIPDLSASATPKGNNSSDDKAIANGVSKAATAIQGVITTGNGLRRTNTGKVIGAISDAATPIASAINPIAGIVVNSALGVIGGIGDMIDSDNQLRNTPPIQTRAWGSDIGITPKVSGVVVNAPDAVVYGKDPKPARTALQHTYAELGFNIPGQ